MTIPKEHEQVLVIDDEGFILTILEAFLKQMGYKALSTTSGIQALEIFFEKKDHISLVILDQTMPDISGAELAAQLRSIRPDIPLIMFSGYGEEEMRRETKGIEINAYMRKPVAYNQLAISVRKALGNTREQVARPKDF